MPALAGSLQGFASRHCHHAGCHPPDADLQLNPQPLAQAVVAVGNAVVFDGTGNRFCTAPCRNCCRSAIRGRPAGRRAHFGGEPAGWATANSSVAGKQLLRAPRQLHRSARLRAPGIPLFRFKSLSVHAKNHLHRRRQHRLCQEPAGRHPELPGAGRLHHQPVRHRSAAPAHLRGRRATRSPRR